MSNMKFPQKLKKLVDECTSGAIGWGHDGTTMFVDTWKFEHEILNGKSDVFKTKNVVSFIRQLNLYGFRKCSRQCDTHFFRNKYFVRGRSDLLKFLKRRCKHGSDYEATDESDYFKTGKVKIKDVSISIYI